MQTGHLASSHSFTFSSDPLMYFGEDRDLTLLELHENGDPLQLSCETERSLLPFVMANLQIK